MQIYLNSLFGELIKCDLSPPEINTLVSDVLQILCKGGHFTISLLNNNLHNLGWGNEVITEKSMKLICQILRIEFKYKISEHTLH